MKRIFVYILIFATIGVMIGLMISLIFSYLSGSNLYSPSSTAFVSQFERPLNSVTVSIIFWMLIGNLFGFGSLIFNIKKWSLTKQTIINFCVYYIGFIPLAFLCGWFTPSIINFMIFTLIFIIIYASIWFINWYNTRKSHPEYR